ncbi:hypothetical protein QO002_000742 [Pararhizobium capsulatum DSM 1112]|uniref:Uncharacterized protein n=1 Tax=Pararhizobium capsulatum DSM 1112 TaxID=1121113 RepID=A0ABU0BK44_9HYPH|nr:hypothetical protein [Pararhizobium capsulatum DSM 1112]
MTSSISTTDYQELRKKTEAETVETAALRELLQRRLKEPLIPAIEMAVRVAATIERKRHSL